MMLYQFILVFIAIFSFLFLIIRFRKGRTSLNNLFLWSVIWILIVFFSFNTGLSSKIANLFGIGRGLDLIIIFAVVLIFYLLFKLYMTLEKIDNNLTLIVSDLALNKEKSDNNSSKIELINKKLEFLESSLKYKK